MKAPFVLIAGLGVASLMGCDTQRIATCPGSAILADTAKAPVFRAGAPMDLSGLAYTATITDVSSDCRFDRQAGQTVSNVDLTVRATRTPTADAASYSLTYFVTVNQSDRVLSKKTYPVRLDFAAGAAVATTTLSPDKVLISLERGHLPPDYQILVGFQLSPEQLAFTKTVGRYVP